MISTNVAFSQIADFDRIDDRVSITNTAFCNLIGMNEGFVEFCSDQDPPSRAELIAWAWLINPAANRPLVEAGADPYFAELVRQQYEHGKEPENGSISDSHP